MDGKQLYLKPDEAKFLSMAVLAMLEDIEASATNVNLPWTPEVRKDFKDMIAAGKGLKIKMAKLGFDMRPLPPFIEGEQRNYFTKPS